MSDIENSNSQATSPTGDIKIFIDTFNSELDKEIKSIQDAKSNYKNVYNDAINIATPLKEGDWPNDPKVLTIGDLFKYTFPDIEGDSYVTDSLNPLKRLKNEQKQMYITILKGISSNRKLKNYLDIKKSGITNPGLYSAGQYYFDVFMKKVLSQDGPIFGQGTVINTYSNNHGLTSSISLFTSNGNKEDKRLDYVDFEEHVLFDIENYLTEVTGIDINLTDEYIGGDFFGLRTEYKSGIINELLNDPNFDNRRGDINQTTNEFIGYFEQMLLYKAFIQAGDNYKSVVLPYNSPADPTPTIENKISNVEQPIDVFKFNVEKQDTFVVVGGSSSTAMEFIILPNDGSEYVFDNSQYDYEALDDEYMEGDFEGEEEYLIQFDSIEVEAVNNIKGFDPNNPDEELSTDTNGKYKVSKDKEANIKSIISAAKSMGVTNKFTISAILAIVSKESGFVPSSEASYSKTSAKRIKEVFSKFRSKSDAEVDEIKKDPVRFFNIIYGGKYGNSSDEGYKYRGRGFNQITFKGNYSQYSKETNIDIVNDPDLLNTVDVAAKCLIAYFKRNIKSSPSDIKNRYNFSDINSFGNLNDATGAIYHANAGWGKSYSEIVADSTGGRKKAFNNAGPLYNSYNSYM